METVIVGAGPTGLYSAIALARRGHRVQLIDRDPGPDPDGTWTRKGVMQFHHPHAVRQQVCDALLAETPEVWDGLIAAGAESMVAPDGSERVVGLRCRRLTFERVLRATAEAEPGVNLRTGHVDAIRHEAGRVVGVRVDGEQVDADLVLDASGRAGRLGRDLRGPVEEKRLRYLVRVEAVRVAARRTERPDERADRDGGHVPGLPRHRLPA